MSREPEQILEDNLVQQLVALGYSFVPVKGETELIANLKAQLESFNGTRFSDREFAKILNHLNKGNVFERAKLLRDKYQLTRDDGTPAYLDFINTDNVSKNLFQVTQQVSIEGKYVNRYDVTLLINGLPLAQIELKRRGLELKEAFNQTNRYHKHSYSASHGLFQFVQIFVISNGVNTKYYANNRKQSFKFTFFWADEKNRNITSLEEFAGEFLNPAHIARMITKYVVMNETHKILMVLRPYQYYAVEAIVERVKTSTENGYIWHTTGSGKTLTSFKASQILTRNPQIHKVVFVVDRKDLDYQTVKEFDSFSKGSVDATEDTRMLVSQFTDDTKLIVTTIQKLNTAISKKHHLTKMEPLRDQRIVFIFDECHRSQFGETHKKITTYFRNHQLFGFTGTPIFAANAFAKDSLKHTTKQLFHKQLHSYVITDAIRDENVLRFSIEYIGRYKENQGKQSSIDIKVEDIDTREVYESEKRLEKIVDYILLNHNRKTYNRKFTSVFAVSSIDVLITYYELFARKKAEGKHNLKVAAIFTYGITEDDPEANDLILAEEGELKMAAEPQPAYNSTHTRDKLGAFIGDYNQMFGTSYTTKDSDSFYDYYKDISKRVKDMEKEGNDPGSNIDILLVVNMFLTGFDGKFINTLYVDKNLNHHGLIQAYSRTNRILDTKSQGNIVCFRNLKTATDDAIALFSNKDAKEDIFIGHYEEYVKKFNLKYIDLLQITPTVDSVTDLPSEIDELEFIRCFRELIRLLNIARSFTDFDWRDLSMAEQQFEDFKSKYLDLHDKVKSATAEKVKDSILDDIDFELELIHRDEVNVAYILQLLTRLKKAKAAEKGRQKKAIIDLIAGEVQLRSKKELIEKFINKNLPQIDDPANVSDEFHAFWHIERNKAFETLCKEERIVPMKLENLIGNYLFSERKPLRDDIVATLEVKPKILERHSIIERVSQRIYNFMETFISGIAS